MASNTQGNPYNTGDKEKLILGLYCETVIGTQEKLHVRGAITDKVWGKNNPDIDLNMVSYLGYPFNWPDGEIFGTVCILNNQAMTIDSNQDHLLQWVKKSLEEDLDLLLSKSDLEKSNSLKTKFTVTLK